MQSVQPFLWPTLQTAVAVAASWEISRRWLHHDRPIFGAITAIVAMGFSSGRRGRQATLIVVGTAVGIVLGDLFLRNLGYGALQLGITVFVTMTLALVVSHNPLFVTQVGISALLLVALGPDSGSRRLQDALLGGGIALVMSLLLFPVDPVASVARSASPVLAALTRSLDQSATALRTGDITYADAARTGIVDQRALLDTIEMALEATRIAPRRRRDRARIEAFATAARSLASLSRGARVIASATQRLIRAGEAPQPDLVAAVAALAAAVRALHMWLDRGDGQSKAAARDHAVEAARCIKDQETPTSLGAATVAHLVQALANHVLAATGLDPAQIQTALAASETAG